jgi:hypothetical protein
MEIERLRADLAEVRGELEYMKSQVAIETALPEMEERESSFNWDETKSMLDLQRASLGERIFYNKEGV